ncbi:MAG: transporter substrate-binding domain-containing protein [Synechococcales bacterium]|nr:transporter substrate-binding domain-containing protein [Synechococcales bacterium]
MKRRNFLLTVSLSALLAWGGTTACTSSNEAEPTDADATSQAGETLVMATSADYPPYEFYETAGGGGEPIGFDIDIAKYITEQLGYELEIQDMDFNGIIPALQAERADFAMAGMTPTEERKQSVDFSQIYYDAKNTIVAPTGSGLESYADLAGKTVGVQLGSIQEGEAKEEAENVEGMTIEPRNRISELIQEIKAGRLDAAIVEDTVAKGYVQNNPDLEFFTVESSGESGSAIAFPQGSPLAAEFDRVLTEMREDGTLDQMITKWFEEYYEQQGS